ncbi:MAG: histidine phosphatase family protein [Cyanobacteria bacterium P01_G01_bin.38]
MNSLAIVNGSGMHYLKLLVIRHAQSLGNAETRMEGQSSTPLSPLGQHQAQRLARYLQHQAEPPSHCYSSPLLRAVQTAKTLIKPYPGLAMSPLDSLQELHQGIFQGLTWAEATGRYPDLCHQLTSTLAYCPVPQAETLKGACHRAQQCAHELRQHQAGDVVWAISHGGFMQYLIAAILGCDRTWQLPIGHTAIFEFWLALNHENHAESRFNPECWQIKQFNNTEHLVGDF